MKKLKKLVIVDPGGDGQVLIEKKLEEIRLLMLNIYLLTHGHFDHVEGVE